MLPDEIRGGHVRVKLQTRSYVIVWGLVQASVCSELLTLDRSCRPTGAPTFGRSGDGKEIMYVDLPENRISSVRVDGVAAQLRFATPQPLFSVAMPLGLLSGSRPLAVSHDGSRIFFLQSTQEPDSAVIHVRTGAIH